MVSGFTGLIGSIVIGQRLSFNGADSHSLDTFAKARSEQKRLAQLHQKAVQARESKLNELKESLSEARMTNHAFTTKLFLSSAKTTFSNRSD